MRVGDDTPFAYALDGYARSGYGPHMTPTKRVAERVKAIMSDRGVTQNDLAAALGVSQQSVSRRVNGLQPWSIDELAIVSDRLGVTLTDLTAVAA